MCMTSVTRRREILDLSGVVSARTIWGGRQQSIVTCYIILKLNGSSITILRQWRIAILVCWCYHVDVVLTRKQAGLQGKGGLLSLIYQNGRSRN